MDQIMEAALREARQAGAEGEVPVGAVLVKDGRILCSAHNQRQQLHDPTAHAEMLCLREGARLLGDWRLKNCTLYVTLEPCPMCAGAMVMSRLGKCVYGASDPDQGCCGSVYDLPADPALHSSTQWEAGAEREACEDVMKEFFRQKRNT